MLTIHHLGISQSERIVWLCEELDVPYKLIKHTREPVLSPESLKSVPGNKTGRSPFIEDPEKGITLGESGAICEYILNTYGPGQLTIKPGEKNYTDYLFWLHYSNASLQANMVASMMIGLAEVSDDKPIKAMVQQRLEEGFKLLDERLKDNKWLAGDKFTAADIMTVYVPTTQRYFGPQCSLAPYPNLLRYLKECSERPAYKRAMEKGDPDMRLLLDAEPPSTNMIVEGGTNSDFWKKK